MVPGSAVSYDVAKWIDTSKISDRGPLVTCGWCAVAACGGAKPRKISVLLIYSELDCTVKREQKVVHETLPTDILNETGCHSPLRVLIFLFPLDNTVERGWPQLLHIWLVPSWSEKCNAYCSSCIFHELDLCEELPALCTGLVQCSLVGWEVSKLIRRSLVKVE